MKSNLQKIEKSKNKPRNIKKKPEEKKISARAETEYKKDRIEFKKI